ncbi:MAG: glycosyltransferase family 2 protein [Candidatus Marinimicrobia bacterium]|nr:glycosyltransferase family 2 protein [Candidatus Neomarinimicrobiota bacterium]MBT3618069.1 glycosyltransferase family 2 protein [Candidatus Neomarinimicrobiota bacterium]MBT3828474.1 glycosyltransferase family 2 protein [Candidatus Neomarinimicrobiota bacterium]MBT3998055.1 glycosyltransferase family 2 protein [Candidatus Neomarinimicrobiota bacterium]MBT4280241.1 glycosyltransferase family 2 protein [Candidatus Neomarinimicrobiota bacterium]
MEKIPHISIIVLNYNGLRFLKTCFDSLYKTTYSNVELLMVDNASDDESVRFVRKNYQKVKIIEAGGNIGYSAGNNLGIKHASGEYVLLLNNDVEVTPGWLEPIIEEFQSDEIIAAVQPKIRHMINRDEFEYAGASGGFMDIYGFPFLRGRVFYTIEKDNGQYDENRDLFWASGASIAIRKSVLDEIGGLDDDFVHHMEEIDLCWRMLLGGYRLRIRTDSMIYHYAGGTIKPDSFMKVYWNHRNSVFMMMKNYSKKRLAYLLPFRFLLDYLVVIKAILTFDFEKTTAVLEAHKWLIKKFPIIRTKRNDVQSLRKVDDGSLDHLMLHRSLAIDYFLRHKLTFNDVWQ